MDELMDLTDDELNARAAMAIEWEEVAWYPASNLYQAFRLQDEVASRGLQCRYASHLVDLLHQSPATRRSGEQWAVASATARLRTIAAVYVLEGGE